MIFFIILISVIGYSWSRKNIVWAEIGMVMTFWPFTTLGAFVTVLQIAMGTRFVVDCNVKPTAFVGQLRMKLPPCIRTPRTGGGLVEIPMPDFFGFMDFLLSCIACGIQNFMLLSNGLRFCQQLAAYTPVPEVG